MKIPVEGGTETVNVTAENAGWNFDGNDVSWLTLTPKSGNGSAAVSLTAQPNTDPTTGRSVAYAFTCTDADWQMMRQFSVSQTARGYFIQPAEKNFTKAAPATQFEVGIEANSSWKAESDAEWLSVQSAPTSLTVSLTDNTTSLTADRIGHITLTCGNATEIITVNQQPPNVTVATDELVYENEGGDKHIEVKSDVPWTASCSQSWMTLSPAEGQAGTLFLLISAAKNMSINVRTANIYVSVGGKQLYSIPICQEGAYIQASVTSLPIFSYKGESHTFNISSNTDWTIIDKPDFVTISPSVGNKGLTSVTVSALANKGEKPLNGSLSFGNSSVIGLQTKVHVEQNCADIRLSEQTITVPSVAGSNHELTITADQGWTAVFAQGTWAHITPANGSGTATLILSADDNPSLKQREDLLTISPNISSTPLTFNFIQNGKYLRVNTLELSIHSDGGQSDPLVISTDGTYNVQTSGDWFQIDERDNTIIARATANESESVRTGTITITMTNLPTGESRSEVITVLQSFPHHIEGGGFTDDKNWDFDNGNPKVSITVEGFTDDKNWEFDSGSENVDITSDGFSDDENWNARK